MLADDRSGELKDGIADQKSAQQPTEFDRRQTKFWDHALRGDGHSGALHVTEKAETEQEGEDDPADAKGWSHLLHGVLSD